ncbi:uncharacterized protein PAC_07622 [Phialocephala subalpina]|uniref:Uncharacterized protein n=1 Tax=Phialocephala subalpina TaxID=576137 RepID=A0A1L7WY91_9HELO|nr:uncharacterized protein PAC_07622 [Phialocephala subalpina]
MFSPLGFPDRGSLCLRLLTLDLASTTNSFSQQKQQLRLPTRLTKTENALQQSSFINRTGQTVALNMVRGSFLIKLRVTAESFAPLHAMRARYDTSCIAPYDYGTIGVMANFLRGSEYDNSRILKTTLSRTASQRAPFDLNLTYPFRNLGLYKYLEFNLRDTLGLEHFHKSASRGLPLRVVPRHENMSERRGSKPRIVIVKLYDAVEADRIVEDLQKTHPNGFGSAKVDAFLLMEKDGENKDISITVYPFTG